MENLQGLKVGEQQIPLPGAPNAKLFRFLASQKDLWTKIELQCSVEIREVTDRHIKYSVKEKDKQLARQVIEQQIQTLQLNMQVVQYVNDPNQVKLF